MRGDGVPNGVMSHIVDARVVGTHAALVTYERNADVLEAERDAAAWRRGGTEGGCKSTGAKRRRGRN